MVTSATSSLLFPFQRKAIEFIQQRKGRAGILAEMGVGKTRIALTYLQEANAQRILVVCPLSVAYFWQEEAESIGYDIPIHILISGTIATRSLKLRCIDGRAMIVVNYEATREEAFKKAIRRWRPDAVVYDEAHRLKSRTSQQAKAAHAFGQQESIVHRLALTGTPVTQGLQDLFSIYKFIDPTVFGNTFADFRDRYLVYGGYQNYQIVAYKNEAECKRLVAQTAYQISKSEAVTLPERTDVMVPVELEESTKRIYAKFKKEAIAEIEGKDEHGQPKQGLLLSRIVLTSIMRLQQLTSGFAMTDTGEIHTSNEKLRVVKQLVEDALESGQKVVIFYRFRWEGMLIAKQLGLTKDAILDGDTPVEQRKFIRNKLTEYGVLLCQIELGEGITLTEASVAIFPSTGFKLGPFLQSRDRIHRIGQERKVTYYYLAARGTIDEKVIKSLRGKIAIAGKVTDLDYTRSLFT